MRVRSDENISAGMAYAIGTHMRLQKRHLARMLVLPILLALVARLGLAHHSGAIFDTEHPLMLHGSVSVFQWANPHCFIELTVSTAGVEQPWSIEMGSPSQLYRLGWRPTTLKPGEAITVVISPMRDGSPGGQFVSAADAAGRPLGQATTGG
jgi:hypothetical protein